MKNLYEITGDVLDINTLLVNRKEYLEATEGRQHLGGLINEYPGEIFVVFDPLTDGAHILGATRTLAEAEKLLNSSCNEPEITYEQVEKLLQRSGVTMHLGMSYSRVMNQFRNFAIEVMKGFQ